MDMGRRVAAVASAAGVAGAGRTGGAPAGKRPDGDDLEQAPVRRHPFRTASIGDTPLMADKVDCIYY